MAFVLPHLLVSLLILLPISSVAQNNGNITVGSSLTATDNSSSWLSPSGDFAFGFRPLNDKDDLFLLSIWFVKIPDKTIVWYASGDTPGAPRGSKVVLTADRGLLLTGPQGEELWRPETFIGTVAYGVMNNTGNFELEDSSFNKIWESFENPTETLLPTQFMEKGGVVSSRESETSFSKGRFQLRLQQDGNLVLNTINLPTTYANEAYYGSGTNADSASNLSSPGRQLVFNESGYIYILRENDQQFLLGRGKVSSGSADDFYFRATLDFDGVFTLYSHPRNSGGNGSWTPLWSVPDNICLESLVSSGKGVCGYNSICTLKADGRPMCECPKGYSLLDPNDRYGNCKPDFTQDCEEDKSSPKADLYTLEELTNTDWPLSDYMLLRPYTEDLCRKSCLEDCMCAVAIFRLGDSCWKKKLPLSNGRVDISLNGGKALIKIRKDGKITNGKITVGGSLSTTDNSSWLSPSGDFAFGFRQFNSTDFFLLSIWYDKIPDRTIVWHAIYENGDYLAPRGSKVELTTGGLVLTSPQGISLWTSQTLAVYAYGIMNDTGNFVLQDINFNNLWESFQNPTDTILPTQIMLQGGGVLSSRQSETNFSNGRFQLRFVQEGNLVLNTINFPTSLPCTPNYFETNIIAGDSNASSPVRQLVFNESGYIEFLKENGERINLTDQGSIPTRNNSYFRVTLDFDGIFALYSHPKTSTGNGSSWDPVWVIPDNICTAILVDEGPGACGFNSVCNLKPDKRPRCACPKGYSLLDPNDPYGSCKPDFIQGCKEDIVSGAKKDLYDVEELNSTDWPKSDYLKLKPFTEENCRNSCLQDCMCAVSIFTGGNTCWKKKLPLSNGRFSTDFTGKAFIKVRKDNSTLPMRKKKNQDGLILAGSVLLGCSVFVNFILIGTICLGFFFIYQKKIKKDNRTRNASVVLEMNLRSFTYTELEEATDGFKEELGRGAFGIVYKGAIKMGSDVLVAVKKLNSAAQEKEMEFKAEVEIIGKTHHKNLVRLLGFCDEGVQRLLVYEFLSNGSLAGFLFGDLKPNWKQRIQTAFGIARGLLYLHEECSTQIIHCDIKPHNILLDDYYNARISDFGLAKLLRMDQSQTHTAIRGTKGYVAPEWFRNMPITTKVDVYSFGVMLLEIICCRRSIDIESGKEYKAILTDWAYDCFRKGTLDVLVEYDMEALDDMEKLEKFVKVAIWCIQEDPSLRPTVRKVMQMLEGVVDVPVAPCPSPFSTTIRDPEMNG